MEVLEQLGMAIGLASLAGINLYLTVFITGLAIRMDWLTLADKFESLQVLASPAVMGVALVLFLIEFFADKVPWLDSVWDVIHTIVRPVGGTLLALQAVGDMPLAVEVVVALLGAGAATTTHATKASTRLMINSSPEPFSNVAVSSGEDLLVIGGLALLFTHPVVALFLFLLLLGVLWWLLPRMWRMIRVTIWLLARKLKVPGRSGAPPTSLPHALKPAQLYALTAEAGGREPKIKWTLTGASGRCKGRLQMAPNWRGTLVRTDDSPAALYFIRRHLSGHRALRVAPDVREVHWESRFMADHLVLRGAPGTIDEAVFRFPRGSGALLDIIVDDLRQAWNLPEHSAAESARPSRRLDPPADAPASSQPSPTAKPAPD